MLTFKKNYEKQRMEIKSLKEEHLRGRLSGCIIDIFDDVFGNTGKEAILLYLKDRGVALKDVMLNPGRFNEGLEDLFGPAGANFIVGRIARKVFLEFGF